MNANPYQGVSPVGKRALDAALFALAALASAGFIAKKADGSFVARTLQEGMGINISNPTGDAGDPTFSVDATELDHGALLGLMDDDHPQYLLISDIDDTPINGELLAPISSNWAFDHIAASDPHPAYLLADGTRALAGSWSLGTNTLTSVKFLLSDDNIYLGGAGTDDLVRVSPGAAGGGVTLDATDFTGSTSYQPLILGGDLVTLIDRTSGFQLIIDDILYWTGPNVYFTADNFSTFFTGAGYKRWIIDDNSGVFTGDNQGHQIYLPYVDDNWYFDNYNNGVWYWRGNSGNIRGQFHFGTGDFWAFGDLQSSSQIRATGWWNNPTGSLGDAAFEIGISAGDAWATAYNRNTSSYLDMKFAAINIDFQPQGGILTRASNLIWDAGNDGSGSGLDADLLDGNEASAFPQFQGLLGSSTTVGSTIGWGNDLAPGTYTRAYSGHSGVVIASHDTTTSTGTLAIESTYFGDAYLHTNLDSTSWITNKLWTAGNDGSGSGLDADLLDGQEGSYYAALSESETITGAWVFNNTVTIDTGTSLPLHIRTSSAGPWQITLTRDDLAFSSSVFAHAGGWYFQHTPSVGGNAVYHQGNDGSGSGLDADTLDSYHAVEFFAIGSPGLADNLDKYINVRVVQNKNSVSYNDGMYIGYDNSNGGRTRIYGEGSSIGHVYPDVNGNWIRNDGALYWHSANDGSGSGLDADLLRGTTPGTIGLALLDDNISTDVLATIGLDADLLTFSLPANTTISAFGASLIDDADAAAARITLGVGADLDNIISTAITVEDNKSRVYAAPITISSSGSITVPNTSQVAVVG